MNSLASAIAQLYEAFARPRPTHVEGCPCCTTPSQLVALTERPLRELGGAELAPYAQQAITTIGTASDFRYFWPRLAELLVTLPPSEFYTDTEVLLGKLPLAEWNSWPEPERLATEQYLAALILHLADVPLAAPDVDQLVCAVGQAVDDVTPWLDAALLADTPAARHNLLGFLDWNSDDIEQRASLTNAFWAPRILGPHANEPNPNVERIIAWLATPRVTDAIARARREH